MKSWQTDVLIFCHTICAGLFAALSCYTVQHIMHFFLPLVLTKISQPSTIFSYPSLCSNTLIQWKLSHSHNHSHRVSFLLGQQIHTCQTPYQMGQDHKAHPRQPWLEMKYPLRGLPFPSIDESAIRHSPICEHNIPHLARFILTVYSEHSESWRQKSIPPNRTPVNESLEEGWLSARTTHIHSRRVGWYSRHGYSLSRSTAKKRR